MSWIHTVQIFDCGGAEEEKSISCFHQNQSWLLVKNLPATSSCAPLMKMSAFVHRLIWHYQWGCTKLQSDLPSIDEPGTLQAANPPASQPSSAPASGWGQTALDWAWRCVGWVKTACSLWSLYANYLQILRETAPGDISKCGACVAASADASLLVMKTTVQSKVACFYSHVVPHCHHTALFSHKIRLSGLTSLGEKPTAL